MQTTIVLIFLSCANKFSVCRSLENHFVLVLVLFCIDYTFNLIMLWIVPINHCIKNCHLSNDSVERK